MSDDFSAGQCILERLERITEGVEVLRIAVIDVLDRDLLDTRVDAFDEAYEPLRNHVQRMLEVEDRVEACGPGVVLYRSLDELRFDVETPLHTIDKKRDLSSARSCRIGRRRHTRPDSPAVSGREIHRRDALVPQVAERTKSALGPPLDRVHEAVSSEGSRRVEIFLVGQVRPGIALPDFRLNHPFLKNIASLEGFDRSFDQTETARIAQQIVVEEISKEADPLFERPCTGLVVVDLLLMLAHEPRDGRLLLFETIHEAAGMELLVLLVTEDLTKRVLNDLLSGLDWDRVDSRLVAPVPDPIGRVVPELVHSQRPQIVNNPLRAIEVVEP